MQIYINIFDNLLLNRDFMRFIVLTIKKENILSFKRTKQKKNVFLHFVSLRIFNEQSLFKKYYFLIVYQPLNKTFLDFRC